MALMAPPPWISDISPRLFLDASSSGARLGLERAGQTLQAGSIANQATEAADKLRESYAALASQNALARAAQQAAQSYHMAGLGLRSNALDSLNAFRDARVGQHQEGLDIARDRLDATNGAKVLHVGSGLYKWDKDAGLTPLIPPTIHDPFKLARYNAVLKQYNDLHKMINSSELDESQKGPLREQLPSLMDQMKQLEGGSPSAGDSLTPNPSAFQPGALDSIGNPAGPATWQPPESLDMSGYGSPLPDAGAAAPTAKSVKIGKYTVTPIGQ